ncbi:hypothetical protein FOXB_10112 [Fusarium oxysporum f. sp. conglutinans Fo5176]|uniref:Uncharacterized protein n=1 Tax=Fusarium oxysporum (strain Fo5176) TaxID=660025 RepID=F9FUN1_FUSOF|nr:hypothetical protein FOXB_10112 [Fusarium oxysporum f. sp. conglutinans Fo5176]
MRHAKHDRTSKVDQLMKRSHEESTCSERSCKCMTDDETQRLWICMLELQQRYGCYTSARMDMALNACDDGLDLMRSLALIESS